MKKLPITVLMVTYNEEVNIRHCFKSVVGHVDEIIIVDNGSADKTVEIAEEYGVKVVKVSHDMYKNQAQMFNWGLDNVEVKNPWIFRLDADEWVTEELWKELEKKLEKTPEEISGYLIKRRVYFMGKWIKYGGYYPTWILRLFRKGKAKYEEREVDEHIILKEGILGSLENDFVDENHKDLEWWINKQNNHSSREVRASLKNNKKELPAKIFGSQPERKRWFKKNIFLKIPIFLRGWCFFFYRYIFKLGFLDGKEGFIFHFMLSLWYRELVDAKLLEKLNKEKND